MRTRYGRRPETADDARQLHWGVRRRLDGRDAARLVAAPDGPTDRCSPTSTTPTRRWAPDQIDAVLVDTAINLGEAARSEGRFAVVAQFEQPGGPDQYGGVVPKGSPNLPIFDALITDLHKTGELEAPGPGEPHQGSRGPADHPALTPSRAGGCDPDRPPTGPGRDTGRVPLAFSHWGTVEAEVVDGRLVALHPLDGDPDPSPIAQNLLDAVDHPLRIRRPAVRRGFLDEVASGQRGRDRPRRRGAEPFVEVAWDEALDLVAAELARVRAEHGPEAVFAGSYGWGSAGRFGLPQNQLWRFLNLLGGFTWSNNSYSYAAAEVLLPYVVGPWFQVLGGHTSYDQLARHGRLVVALGGLPAKNQQVENGGTYRHLGAAGLRALRDAGVRIVSVSPLRSDADEALGAEWLPVRPGTDTALLLGIAAVLVEEGLVDEAFLDRCCSGVDRFLASLRDAGLLRRLGGRALRRARRAHPGAGPGHGGRADDADRGAGRCNAADHGEQAYWATVAVAALLGQIGTPGGGFGLGYGSVNRVGSPERGLRPAPPADRPEPGHVLHPRRPHHRAAGAARGHRPLRRRRADPARHPGRLLVRRQPLPPPPAPRAAGPGLAAARGRDRPRAGLEPPGPAGRPGASRSPRRSSATTSAPPRSPARWWPCPPWSRRPARPATTSRSSPRWPNASGVGEAFTEGLDRDRLAAPALGRRPAPGPGPGLRPARLRGAVVQGRGHRPAAARRSAAGAALGVPGRSRGLAPVDAERSHRAGLRRARRLRAAGLPAHAHLAGAGRVAGRAGRGPLPPPPAVPPAGRAAPQPARLRAHLPAPQGGGSGGAAHLAGRRRGPGIADGDVVRVFNDRGACLAGALLDDGILAGVVCLPPAPGSTPSTPTTPPRWSCRATPTC